MTRWGLGAGSGRREWMKALLTCLNKKMRGYCDYPAPSPDIGKGAGLFERVPAFKPLTFQSSWIESEAELRIH